jgi:hypothetical protein
LPASALNAFAAFSNASLLFSAFLPFPGVSLRFPQSPPIALSWMIVGLVAAILGEPAAADVGMQFERATAPANPAQRRRRRV